MDRLRELTGDFGHILQGVVVIVVVAALLAALSRILKGRSDEVSGKRFRNQLILFAAGFAGLILIILGLPLDGETRSQLLTLLGIIISAAIALSGSTLLSNAMAGIMLKAVRNFRSGDFLQTGEHFGRVTERGLFHTEIQTPDRDLVTLPNQLLATSAVRVVRASGTIVSATVSLGYDLPHSRIEECLLEACRTTGLEEPFVQILELGDYSVVYRAAGLLTETKQMLAYRSRLRAAILDGLHGAGMEIVSPAFTNARVFQPGDSFIPRGGTAPADPAQDAAPVDVVFDKAEEAESLSRLEEEYRTGETGLDQARKELKEAADDAARERLQRQVENLERRLEALARSIAAAREKEEQTDS